MNLYMRSGAYAVAERTCTYSTRASGLAIAPGVPMGAMGRNPGLPLTLFGLSRGLPTLRPVQYLAGENREQKAVRLSERLLPGLSGV